MPAFENRESLWLARQTGGLSCALLWLLLAGAAYCRADDKSGVSPTAISLPKGPGSIEGLGESFQPSLNTGTAKYGIALKLPPGTGGNQLQLNLSYEGGSGNGPLGYGWHMAMPSVQRRSDKGIPTYGEDMGFVRQDVFINQMKEELVPQSNGFYFCKNEGAFIRYQQVGEHWEATLPNGTKLEFGLTSDARIEDSGRVFSWLLERQTDTRANTILFSYYSVPGESNLNHKYLQTIRYGPGAPPWSNYHFVRLEYENRPDWFEDCRSGFVVRTGQRLKSIAIGTQGPVLAGHLQGDFDQDGTPDFLDRRYDLGYLQYAGTNSHWSLLAKVVEVGADGASTLPPATFGYAVCNPPGELSAAGREIGATNEPAVVMDNELVDLVDLNGDGLPDILKTESNGGAHVAFLNLGQIQLAQGKVIQWQSGVEVDAGGGEAWNYNLSSTSTHLADMDGDGLADFVHKSAENDIFYFRNRGRVAWGDRQAMSVQDSPPPAPFGRTDVRTADLDFDKRIDIVQSVSAGGGTVYRIWFNLGDQTYSPPITVQQTSSFSFSDKTVQIADCNGDRVPDIARVQPGGVVVTAGLGYGRFAEPVTISLPDYILADTEVTRARLTDINGDGLADLVLERAAPGECWYWLNLGNYTFSPRRVITGMPTAISANAAVRWADLNGNGTTDLVYADHDSTPRIRAVDLAELLNCGPTPNILNAISNGIGRVTLIGYEPSTTFALQDAAVGQPWTNLMPIAVSVVSAVTNSDSLGHQYVTQFHYHDGYYDPKEKQFRGFGHVEQIEIGDPTAPTLVTRSYFDTGDQFEAMKGKLLRLTVEQEDGKVFTDAVTSWTIPPKTLIVGTNGQQVSFAHPVAQVETIKELGQGVERRLESEQEFDNYGNQTLHTDYGIVENGDRTAFDDERIIATEYALNLDAWIIRHPKRQETRKLDGTVISRTESYYDDETFSANNLGVVTVGNLTLSRGWVDTSNPTAYINLSRTKYDSYGNAVDILDPLALAPSGVIDQTKGHTRTITYDDRFQTYAVAETIQLGAGKDPLDYRAAYDEAFGTLLTATDFNTFTTVYIYDSLARLTSIIKPGDTPEYPTSEYTYALAVPFGAEGVVNYIETRLLDQTPGSRPGKLDHYMISREFSDGMGRKLMTKKEAESQGNAPGPAVVVSSAVTFNARRTTALALNPFLSLSGNGLEALLDYESIEAAVWKGLFHENGNLLPLGLEEAHKTASRYDAKLREVESTNPDGSVEKTVYEPLVTRSYDANQTDPSSPHFGASMARFEDGLDRLIRVDEVVRLNDDGTPAETANTWTTRYEYDVNDQLIRITDSQNNVKLMAYDGLKRNRSLDDPDRGIMRFLHDDAGNLIETIDAKNQRISYTFDGVHRMLSEDYHQDNPQRPRFDPSQPITPANRPDVAYFYDTPVSGLEVGDGTTMTAENTVGLLAYVWDQTGEEHYSYDRRERGIAIVKRVIDPLHGRLVSYRTGYTFDSLDRLTSVRYPDDDLVRYTYDERSLGKSISGGPTGGIISNMLYSPAGQLTLVQYGNGVETSSSYDSSLRLQQMRTVQPQLGLEHVAFAYEFDPASNVKAIADLRSASSIPDGDPRRNTQMVDYDDLYRMTGVQYSFSLPDAPRRRDGEIRYRYDRIGNLLSQTSDISHLEKGFSVTDLGAMDYGGTAGRAGRVGRQPNDPPGPHALTQIRSPQSAIRNYPYDANGNMSEIDGLQATWDTKDRLIALENSEMRAEYTYDHNDRRVIKKVLSKSPAGSAAAQIDSTIYLNQYFEVRQNGVPIKYVWCGNARVARVTGSLSGTQRLQRLRLWKGWNLCSLSVTAEDTKEQLAAGGSIASVFRWDAVAGDFKELTAAETLTAGTVLWLQAVSNATVVVRGVYDGNPPPSHALAGPVFHPGAFFELLDLGRFAPVNTALWRFSSPTQRWQARLPEALTQPSDLPDFLAPGEAVFVRAESELVLSLPDEAQSIRYYQPDHLGSSAVITDANGIGLEETCLYPFGFPRYKQKSAQQSDPYQFTQKERDRESGLNCMEARFQSPILGRFLRVDPLAGALKSGWLDQPQRLNLYAYCANSPIGHADASGTDLVAAFKGFGIGVAEGAWAAVPKDPYLLNPVTAGPAIVVHGTVGLYNRLAATGERLGDVAYAVGQGDYKKAAIRGLQLESVDKLMDPNTSDEEMGRMIGKSTGSALAVIAMSKIGPKGAKAPPGEPPPLPGPKPQTTTQKMPPPAPKTLRDPKVGERAFADTQPANKLADMKKRLMDEVHNERWMERYRELKTQHRGIIDEAMELYGTAERINKSIYDKVNREIGPLKGLD